MVHRNHGVGRFKAMEKLAISGDVRDYLVVQYADGLLRVAADQLGSLGRYRATSEKAPELNRMGGTAWTKAKERARKAVRKVAMDLVKLYAERHKANGFAYPTGWALAERARGILPLRTHPGPAEGDRRCETGHGKTGADGSTRVR